MKETVLEIKHLDFHYDAAPALIDVNLEVAEGEFIGIFGPNGGGKTTLLKLILGLLSPKKGSIHLCGQTPQAARHLIGYVPHSIRISPSA